MVMTNEDKLYEVDIFLAMCEDFMHGKDGDDVTRCRKLLTEVIKELSKMQQPTVSGQCECEFSIESRQGVDFVRCVNCGDMYFRK